MELVEKLEAYEMKKQERDELKKHLSEKNGELEQLRKEVTNEMILSECSVIGHNGYNYYLQNKVHYTKKAGEEELLFQLLRENGLGEVIKEQVNPRTLESTMKSFVEEMGELPEEFENALHVYETADILRRKA